MEKPLFVFFAHGLIGAVRRAVIMFFAALLVANGPVFGDLPAYDLERVIDNRGAPRVGDEIFLKVSGAASGLVAELLTPEQSEKLRAEGWELILKPEGVLPSDAVLVAVPLKPGQLTLPSFVLKDVSGRTVARTNPFVIQVGSAIRPDDPKPEEPVDLRPPVNMRFPWWVVVVFSLIGLLVILAVGYLLWRRFRKRGRKAPVLPVAPPKTEDEVALAALKELQAQQLHTKREYKKHYFGVSEILKLYFGARYKFDAPESTTHEMIAFMERGKEISDATLDRIETLFERLDLVKFTDHVPNVDEASKVVEDARQLVLLTRKTPVPPVVVPRGSHAS